MRAWCSFVACLAFFSSAAAQSTCRQATATLVERHREFDIFSVSLPSGPRSLLAKAVIPNLNRPAGAFVFSLSTVTETESRQIVELMPAAIALAKKGHAAVLIQRTLTWPIIDKTVGRMGADVLCAEQWLSTHANAKADDWTFVGPEVDEPTLDQLRVVEKKASSMTFYWGFPLAGFSENKNTDNVLRYGVLQIADMPDTHD
jgi:hypothetical protein